MPCKPLLQSVRPFYVRAWHYNDAQIRSDLGSRRFPMVGGTFLLGGIAVEAEKVVSYFV